MTDLSMVLADAREDAARLRMHGHGPQAASIEAVCERVAEAMRGWLTLMSEKEAMLRTGWSSARLRGRHAEWMRQGLALIVNGRRVYRECALPVRTELSAAREAGRRGEKVG